MCRASWCLALSECSVTASREVKMATIRRERVEREDTDCALREPTAWCAQSGMNDTDSHIHWICMQLNVRLFSVMASQLQDTIQVLQRIWHQPAFVCRKMPELRGLKGSVADVIIIFLHSISQRERKNLYLEYPDLPQIDWVSMAIKASLNQKMWASHPMAKLFFKCGASINIINTNLKIIYCEDETTSFRMFLFHWKLMLQWTTMTLWTRGLGLQ